MRISRKREKTGCGSVLRKLFTGNGQGRGDLYGHDHAEGYAELYGLHDRDDHGDRG